MAEEKKAFKKGREKEKSSFERKRNDQDWKVRQASGGLTNEMLKCCSRGWWECNIWPGGARQTLVWEGSCCLFIQLLCRQSIPYVEVLAGAITAVAGSLWSSQVQGQCSCSSCHCFIMKLALWPNYWVYQAYARFFVSYAAELWLAVVEGDKKQISVCRSNVLKGVLC